MPLRFSFAQSFSSTCVTWKLTLFNYWHNLHLLFTIKSQKSASTAQYFTAHPIAFNHTVHWSPRRTVKCWTVDVVPRVPVSTAFSIWRHLILNLGFHLIHHRNYCGRNKTTHSKLLNCSIRCLRKAQKGKKCLRYISWKRLSNLMGHATQCASWLSTLNPSQSVVSSLWRHMGFVRDSRCVYFVYVRRMNASFFKRKKMQFPSFNPIIAYTAIWNFLLWHWKKLKLRCIYIFFC